MCSESKYLRASCDPFLHLRQNKYESGWPYTTHGDRERDDAGVERLPLSRARAPEEKMRARAGVIKMTT